LLIDGKQDEGRSEHTEIQQLSAKGIQIAIL
jgi:hypothetical protein